MVTTRELVSSAVREHLEAGSATLSSLHRDLVASAPDLAARGPRWLAYELDRLPDISFDGDRYRRVDGRKGDRAAPEPEGERQAASQRVDARRYVVFDLETNVDRADPAEHEIIEVGAVRVQDGIRSETFSRLARSTRTLSETTTSTTGLTDEEVSTGDALPHVLSAFLDFVGDDPLIAHNGFGYDFLVLDAALARHGLAIPQGPRLDSLEVAHVCLPRAGANLAADVDGSAAPGGRDLGTLTSWYATEKQSTHRALDDAVALAQVIDAMRAELTDAAPSAALAAWLLASSKHPWAAFLASHSEQCGLADVIPTPEPVDAADPTGVFDPAQATQALEEGGALLTSGREHRPQQTEMASLVARAFADGRRQVIEAPTGTGKTLAYLLPALAYARAAGRCVVVAAHSKVLQNQILTSLPELETVHPGVNAVMLKGRENYLSLEALDGVLEQAPEDPEEGLALAVITRWAARTPTGDWDDLRVWAIERRVRALPRLRWQLVVDQPPGVALDPLDERCFYRRALERLETADLAVLNHAVLLTQQHWLDHAGQLVLDEAHNLEDTATAALSEEVTEATLTHLLDSVDHPATRWGTLGRWLDATGTSARHEQAVAVREARAQCDAAMETLSRELIEYVRSRSGARREEVARFGASYRLQRSDLGRSDYRGIRHAAQRLAAALRGLAAALQELEVPSDGQLKRRYRRRRLEAEISRIGRAAKDAATSVFEILSDVSGDGSIHVVDLRFEDERYRWGVRQVPLSVAPQLSELWEELDSVVLTSATLFVDGSASHLIDRLGLGAASARQLPSPFEALAEQQIVVLPDHLPTPTGGLLDEFADAEADEIVRLFTLTFGRGMALFTSRARMDHVYAHAHPQLDERGLPLLVQGSAPSPALVERMRAETATSLLATRSFWEGIDIPGEELSLLVIEKVPFDSPADPVVSARMETLEQEGLDPFGRYLVPQAIIRFAQGVGRLIRSRGDIGAVVVLDKRLRRATPYRDRFLQALPGPPRFVRPGTAEEGYAEIAGHLGLPFDAETREALRVIDSADVWADLPELELSDEDLADEATVLARLDELRSRFGFDAWRPGQLEVMLRMLRGEDVVAVLPTGSGKSLTFQLPALLRPELTVVVSPLIALMRDQVRGLREQDLHQVAALHTGQPQTEQEEILSGARAGRYRLLYLSPERLWSKRFRSALEGLPIARVVVDEAHCVSQWGHTFRPEYAAIVPAVDKIVGQSGTRPPVAALTATATPAVQKDLLRILELDTSDPVTLSADRRELRYYAVDCADKRDRDARLLRVVEAFRGQAVIVYTPRKADTTRLARLLSATNHAARAYHGGMETEERRHTEEAFEHGEIDVIVATKAFGLGVDKPDIAAVVHLEMPASVEEYIQETGRCARGAAYGKGPATGACVLLRMPRDCGIHRTFITHAAPDLDVVRGVWQRLEGGSWTGRVEDLGEGEHDREDLALAVSYLVDAGAVERHDDLSWQGRVWIPPSAGQAVADLAGAEPELAERATVVLDAAERLGDEQYSAPRWADATGMSAGEVEATLLALQRRDIVGFTAFDVAWQLTAVGTPPWRELEAKLGERRASVRALSDHAKQYKRNDASCRRGWLLAYLGEATPTHCDGCDVCRPDLPRPWDDVELAMDDVVAGIPTRQPIVTLVADLQQWEFGRRTVEKVLAAADLQYQPRLQDHPQYGALEVLGADGVERAIDGLASEGLLEEYTVERDDRAYPAVRLTDAGRRLLR